jgi:antitoxin (DNA-binding transcriptional repressor) of toxin-antitoxin stability system
MHTVNLEEAEGHLAEFVEEAARGEKVVIFRKDGFSLKLVPVSPSKPRFGSAKGLIRIAADFDEP